MRSVLSSDCLLCLNIPTHCVDAVAHRLQSYCSIARRIIVQTDEAIRNDVEDQFCVCTNKISSLDRWGILQNCHQILFIKMTVYQIKSCQRVHKDPLRASTNILFMETYVFSWIHRSQHLAVWSLLLQTNTQTEIPQADSKGVFSDRTQRL